MDDDTWNRRPDAMFETTLAILIAGIIGSLFLYFGTGVAARLLADQRAASFRGAGRLALTYDDGPSPRQTDRILEILAARGASATFFVIGRSAERHAAVIDRITEAGHEIGWHSRTHRNQWRCGPLAAWSDTTSIPGTLEPGGSPMGVYRPPYGNLNLASVLGARSRGLGISTWTLASGDTYPTIPSVREVVDRVDAEGGGVVLMHDMERDTDDAEARDRFVVDLSVALLDLARDRGWQVSPVPESSRNPS